MSPADLPFRVRVVANALNAYNYMMTKLTEEADRIPTLGREKVDLTPICVTIGVLSDLLNKAQDDLTDEEAKVFASLHELMYNIRMLARVANPQPLTL